jgi:Tol biopolymer transport system component
MLRLVLLAALVAALFPATATAAGDGPVAFVVAEAGFDIVGPDGAGRRPLLRESGAYSPAWSPDGRWVVYSAGELRAVAADGSRVVGLGVTGAAPEWSPDGTRIAFHAGGDIQVAHVTQDLQVLRVDRVTAGRSPTWSPDGARLAYVDVYGDLWVIEAGGGTPERLAPGLAAEDPDWSPDGRRIAVASGADLWTVDLATGTAERLLAGASQPAWSPSGGRLAYSAGGDVRALDLASGGTATLAGGPGSETAPTWAPVPGAAPRSYAPGVEAGHAGRIAFTRGGEIYVMNPGGGDLRRLTHNDVVDGQPAWAPPVPGLPARLAFTRGGHIRIMRADGSGVRRLTHALGLHRSPAWSPDGTAIAFTRIPPGGAAQVWIAEVNGGGERRVSPAGPGAYANPSWSADGSKLAFERVDTSVLIPPNEPPVKLDTNTTRVLGLGFCSVSLVTGELECRDSVAHELAPIWGGAHERALGRLVYVASGTGAPDFGLFQRALWSTELVTGTPYAHLRWAYDTRIFADLQDPADPAAAPDGSGLTVAARQDLLDDELDIAVVRTHRRHQGEPKTPGWYVIEADTIWLAEGSQPAWEARRAPLPALADGAFERRSRVRGRLRGRTLTLVNRNRFWVTARVRRRSVRLRPATRRRATVRQVRVGGRVRRVRILDAAGHRRAIGVRSLNA